MRRLIPLYIVAGGLFPQAFIKNMDRLMRASNLTRVLAPF
jgi:hypothetical protein